MIASQWERKREGEKNEWMLSPVFLPLSPSLILRLSPHGRHKQRYARRIVAFNQQPLRSIPLPAAGTIEGGDKLLS